MKVRDENGWTLFSHDPKTGVTVWKTTEDGQDHFRTDYPVDNVVAQNQYMQAEMRGARRSDGIGDLVASVPLNVAYAALTEAHSHGDDKYLSKWLNDGDNAAFRVREGRL